MGTSSFLDRLRGTGPLTPDRAREHGALGPIGKASGYADDARLARPYDAYPLLGRAAGPRALRRRRAGPAAGALGGGDQAFRLHPAGRRDLPERPADLPRVPATRPRPGGRLGRGAAGRGALRRDRGGRPDRPLPAGSASFHNLVLMHEVFAGDILTDFPFIEASFGLSVAGAAL